MLNKKYKEITLVIAASIFLLLILSKPLRILNNNYADLEFKVRGQSKIDSNIIILYVDNAIMDSLGSVPLKWIYYNRLINDLSNLGVRAIGIDMLFDKNSPDYPGQAAWLVGAIKKSHRVCVGMFFNKVFNEGKIVSVKNNLHANSNKYIIKTSLKYFPYGKGLNIPFPWLLNSAAGFGHLNFDNDLSIRKLPLIIDNADSGYIKKGSAVPSITLELLRVYYKLPFDSIQVSDNHILIKNGGKSINIPASYGKMTINYAGGINTLNMHSISEFLKNYHSFIRTGKGKDELRKFKNKIVLIGSMAKHTGQFTSTPFSNKFPVVGVYANAIATILHKQFLRKVPLIPELLISVVFAVFIFSFLFRNGKKVYFSLLASAGIIFLYIIISFILFENNIVLSIQPVFISLIFVSTGVVKQMKIISLRFENIKKEKQKIEALLKNSSDKIQSLQTELIVLKNNRHANSSADVNDDTAAGQLLAEYNNTDVYPVNYLQKQTAEFFGLVYSKNGKMERVVNLIKKVAATDATILILGESGTGKELAARAIHDISNRKDKKFVAINCGAIPETLLESELFGYEEGAYTGANKSKEGYFETADEGTIFLDEITETSELFQTKLLRVLQQGEFNHLGGTKTIKVNVRILAATNKKIDELVKDGKFRLDIYYRLNVIRLYLPPLRERKKDIPLLAGYFLRKEAGENFKISGYVMQAFLNYNWPGNVRQLESVIKHAVIFAGSEGQKVIQINFLPSEILNSLTMRIDMEEQILNSLRRKKFSRNSINETARILGGIHRSTVAEHLRGICFREYCLNNFNIENTVRSIGRTEDKETLIRVKKKLNEYISHLLKHIDGNPSFDSIKETLHLKYKKLPVKYHTYIEQIALEVYTERFIKQESEKN